MKKWMMLLASALMVLSLGACTPTTEKNQADSQAASQSAQPAEQTNGPDMPMPATTEAYVADTMEKRNQGNENLPSMAAVSIYRFSKNGHGLIQEMDSLETEELEAQGIVDLMIDYGVLEDGTEVLSFEENDGKATLNLNQITSSEDAMTIRMTTESIVNTFTENYELDGGLILQENGTVYTLDAMDAEEDGTMYYNDAYRKFE